MNFLAGVGLGMLIAVLGGLAFRHATQAGRAVRETETRLPVLREARTGARFKAGFWLAVGVAYFVALVLWQASN